MRPLVALLVLVCACSEPAPEVTPEPEADEPEAPAPDEPEDETTDPPPVRALPDPLPEITSLPVRPGGREFEMGGEFRWPVIEHPDEGVREALAGIIDSLVRELSTYVYAAHCRAGLAHESLVSVSCTVEYETRGGMGLTDAQLHLAINGGRLHPVSLSDMFEPDFDLDALIEARCQARREVGLRAHPGSTLEHAQFDELCEQTWAFPTPEGLAIRATNTFVHHMVPMEVPWAELREHVRADGPLAPVFGADPVPFPAVDEADATGWAVTSVGPTGALVRRWMEVDPAQAGGLVVEQLGGRLTRLVLPGTDSDTARRIAGLLGGEATPVLLGQTSGRVQRVGWDEHRIQRDQRHDRPSLPVRWVHTTEDLNLHSCATSERHERPLAILPAGSMVAAVGGGSLRRAGAYVRVVTAFGEGTLASRHLRAHEECVVAPGESGRHAARVQFREAGASRDAWLVWSRLDRGSRVALRERGDDCALGDPILEVDVERPAFDVRLVGTTPHGGHTLLVVGTSGARREPPFGVRYRVWRRGRRGPVLDETFEWDPEEDDFESARLGETVDETYFPFTLGDRRYEYRDGALVAVAPPG